MVSAARKLLLVALVALFALPSVRSAQAATDVTAADLQAAARALGFLEGLPNDGTLVVAIVYSSRAPESKALAVQTAGRLGALPGPNKTVFRTKIFSVADLAQTSDRLDAIFLLPGLSTDAETIVEVLRRRRVVSISNDPTCLDANCCVLMVRAGNGVEIVLHTALATAVSANFSAVFTMMVKRK